MIRIPFFLRTRSGKLRLFFCFFFVASPHAQRKMCPRHLSKDFRTILTGNDPENSDHDEVFLNAYKVGPLPVITGFITPITRVIRTVSHL